MSMKVIEGEKVDLISPFPVEHVHRVYDWMHQYKSIVETDLTPKTLEEYCEAMRVQLTEGGMVSYGVIDKHNVVGYTHPAPLVGIVGFEPHTAWNCYIHLAMNRRAWKYHMADEAVTLALRDVFENTELLRVSAFVLENNRPVRYMAQRMNFVREGLYEDWCTQEGKPVNVMHFGLTKTRWMAPVITESAVVGE